MANLLKEHPDQMPTKLGQIPLPSVEEIEADPKLAGFTYQRQQCQRCHVAIKGREKRGDYRGMGCSSCLIPCGNEGYYEGGDPTINKEEQGHMLVHRIQGTREAKVKVRDDMEYSGIPVETCNSCHNRGKCIGVTYQGLMEFPYGSPFNERGEVQPKLHTKQYLFISDDLHHQYNQSRPENPTGGMLCQDCHGTPATAPWDLPLGYSEEFAKEIADLDYDWSTIIKDDQQVQTVGTHWPLSRALTKEMRTGMERTGLCMGCHREMSNAELWGKVATEGQLTDEQHIELMNKMLKAYGDAAKK